MKPYTPIYHKPPNKFIRYEMRDFADGYGHSGKVRVAIFKDSKGRTQEMDAQIYWSTK